MKIIKQTTIRNLTLLSCLSWAALVSAAGNQLQNVSVNEAAAGKVEVHLSFDTPVTIPKGFVMQDPPRLVFDFPGVEVSAAARRNQTKRGVIQSVQAAGNKGQTRLVFTLNSLVSYSVEAEGSDLILLFDSGSDQAGMASQPAPAMRSARQPVAPVTSQRVDPNQSYNWYTDPAAKDKPQPVHRPAPAPRQHVQQQAPARVQHVQPPAQRQVAPPPVMHQQARQEQIRQQQARMTPVQRSVRTQTLPTDLIELPPPASVTQPRNTFALHAQQVADAVGWQQVAPNSAWGGGPVLQGRQGQAQGQAQTQYAQAHSEPARRAAPQQVQSTAHALRSVDFRREEDGGGRIIVTLPDAKTRVTADKVASVLNLVLHDIDVPPNWEKRMDVTEFATPVSTVQISQRGMNGRVSVMAGEDFTYRTDQNGNVYTVYIDKIKAKKKEKLGEKKAKSFNGEKLSLNFQDIEVRAVLQLLADFTNKNIVVSDSVDGNITVRLKDVPWDQALDIVLESKNLGMRENGNVIWVAPNTELEAKDAQELEVAKRKVELEPTVTEYIPINFAKAADLATLIEKRGSGASADAAAAIAAATTATGGHSLLSNRGSVSFDARTNTLLVQDTASQVAAIRDLIKVLDVPVQQVSIESRIVIANDTFGKELGARFGVTPKWNTNGSSGIATGHLGSSTDSYYDSVGSGNASLASGGKSAAIKLPGLSDRLSVNLPVTGAAGSFGFSILASDFLLDLELSALQAESKGEIIATPRVITSNQTKALIEQGVEIPYQEASSSGATSVSFKKAVLSLEVTPQITPDEHISMDLRVNQDTVGQVYANVPSIDTREIQTKVLVENGQTIVLGGVHEENRIKGTTKVPVLGDLPVVGQLFRKDNKSETKRELLIFVTPRIIDSKS